MSDNPRLPLLGLLTTAFGLGALAAAGFIANGLLNLPEFSWVHLAIAAATGWLGLWQCVAGYGLLRHGFAGAGTAADWAETMLDPNSILLLRSRPLLFVGGEIDVASAAWLRIVGCVLAAIVVTVLAMNFPDRIPLLALIPIAASVWPAIVSLRIAHVHDRLEAAQAKRPNSLRRNPQRNLYRDSIERSS